MKIEIIKKTYWGIFGNEILRNSHRHYRNKFHKKSQTVVHKQNIWDKRFSGFEDTIEELYISRKENVKSKNVQTENIP